LEIIYVKEVIMDGKELCLKKPVQFGAYGKAKRGLC